MRQHGRELSTLWAVGLQVLVPWGAHTRGFYLHLDHGEFVGVQLPRNCCAIPIQGAAGADAGRGFGPRARAAAQPATCRAGSREWPRSRAATNGKASRVGVRIDAVRLCTTLLVAYRNSNMYYANGPNASRARLRGKSRGVGLRPEAQICNEQSSGLI